MTPEQLDPEVQSFLGKTISGNERIDILPITEYPPTFIEILDQIKSISGNWNPVEIFTAESDSINGEKQKFISAFLNGEQHTPSFTYSTAEKVAEKMKDEQSRDKLVQLKKQVFDYFPKNRSERLMRIGVYSKIKDDLATIDMTEGIVNGDDELTAQAMRRKYGGVNEELIEHAINIYNESFEDPGKKVLIEPLLSPEEQEFLKNQQFNAEELKMLFEWSLAELGILKTDSESEGFQVIISNETTDIDVRDKSSQGPTIFIPTVRGVEGETVDGEKALGLIEHEIRGHARQSMNGYKQFLIGGGQLKFDNETLYEGLAKRYDEEFIKQFFGKETGKPIPYYTFAVADAELGKSFYDIFSRQFNLRLHTELKHPLDQPLPKRDQIDEGIFQKSLHNAWRTTYRVLRGHTDMSNPHAFAMAKDLSYLRGWLMDNQLKETGYGYINEIAIIPPGGLSMIAEFNIPDIEVPYPDKPLARLYWQKVLKPRMVTSSNKKNI